MKILETLYADAYKQNKPINNYSQLTGYNSKLPFISVYLVIALLLSCTKVQNTEPAVFAEGAMRATASKTNVIIIITDDIGYEVPAYTGGSSYYTPNIDNLARNGMQFTQCYASPLCSPSRFMLFTGKYNFRNYVAWGKMPLSEKTIGNMMSDAGYATCISGKWQFDGGDSAIHNFGFQKYMVWDPYYKSGSGSIRDSVGTGQYKNPKIYADGNYLTNSVIANKYGEDFFRQYLFDFIDSNASKPFFAVWAMNLCHKNFSPTPDDPEFATWNSYRKPQTGDSIFFPSMVKYMDKQVGMLVSKLQQSGLDENTIILFTSDNGTPPDIHSMYCGQMIQGQKGHTNYYGTHVPLIAYMPGSIQSGAVNNDLIDFTDFLPTLADLAHISIPDYGTIDGKSFEPALNGIQGYARDWVYCYYYPHPERSTMKAEWVNNKMNKLYGDNKGFFDTQEDPFEKYPIPYNMLTPEQQANKTEFENVLSQLHN